MIFDSSGHRKVHMVKVILGELNFVHELVFHSFEAVPTKYLMLQIKSHYLSGLSRRTSKNSCRTDERQFECLASLSTTLFSRQQIGWKHTCEVYLYLQKIVFNKLVTQLSSYYVKKYFKNKNSTNHIFIIIHRNMTLNGQKQCSLSYLLNAADRSRL
jgi:hypothetical protein